MSLVNEIIAKNSPTIIEKLDPLIDIIPSFLSCYRIWNRRLSFIHIVKLSHSETTLQAEKTYMNIGKSQRISELNFYDVSAKK